MKDEYPLFRIDLWSGGVVTRKSRGRGFGEISSEVSTGSLVGLGVRGEQRACHFTSENNLAPRVLVGRFPQSSIRPRQLLIIVKYNRSLLPTTVRRLTFLTGVRQDSPRTVCFGNSPKLPAYTGTWVYHFFGDKARAGFRKEFMGEMVP